MPVFSKVLSLFADWHSTERRNRSFIDKIKGKPKNIPMSRTEQLGLPQPRKLLSTKQEFRHILEERRLQNLDKHLDKSLKTIYCRLVAQKQKPVEPVQKKRKSCFKKSKSKSKSEKPQNSKEEHEKWLMNIAKPKCIFLPEELVRVKGNVDINRIIRLAQPRYRPAPDPEINNISKATLKYVATERILSLAHPKREKSENHVYEIPRISFPINPEYMSVKSHGIDKLAIPQNPKNKYIKVDVDVRCSYNPVSRGALQYEASDKVRKLAKPKTVDEEEVSDPYKVKKKALRKLQKKQEKIFLKMSTPIEWKVTPKYEVGS